MQFENSFTVDAPIDEVWKAILDVERVARYVPGAEVLEKTGENAYKVGIKVKLGPITMQYRGDMEIVEQDDAAHRAVMRAKAKEARGQGTADATVTMALSEEGGSTTAVITTDLRMSGRAAAMSRGVVSDVAAKLINQFSDNLQSSFAAKPAPPEAPAAPPPPSAPPRQDVLDAGDLAGSVLADRLKDPRLLIVAAALVVVWLLKRRA